MNDPDSDSAGEADDEPNAADGGSEGTGAFDVEDVLRRAQAGEQAAITLLFEHFKQLVRSAARRQLGDARRSTVDSEDLQMITLEEFLGRIAKFDFKSEEQFQSFLARMAEHNAIDELRRRGAGKRALDRQVGLEALEGSNGAEHDSALADGSDSPSQDLIRREELELLQRKIASLPDRLRQVMELRLAQHSWKEIATLMNFPTEGAARMHHRRARFQLIEDMGAKDHGADRPS